MNEEAANQCSRGVYTKACMVFSDAPQVLVDEKVTREALNIKIIDLLLFTTCVFIIDLG